VAANPDPSHHEASGRLIVRATPLTPPFASRFARFLLVGGLCTALQYLILVAGVRGFGLSATLSSTLGYVASTAVNYYLNHRFTFASESLHRHALPRFLLIVCCGLALNAAVTFVGTSIYGLHYIVAQMLATCVTLLWNFLANSRWTF
jgi:putative flippase GtrA